jgi:hypothetical protein
MLRMNFADTAQSAFNFLVSQLTVIEPQVYKMRYADIQYPSLVPVDTSGSEWAKSFTFFSQDMVGQADWFHHMAMDIPLADITREKKEVGVEMAGIGYHYTMEELGQAMMIPGFTLTTDRAAAAKRAYEEFVDGVVLRGAPNAANTVKGWKGLINEPSVTVAMVAADGTGGSPAFDDKTADQVLRDINDALTGVYVESLTVEMADTILMPIQTFASLGTRRIPSTTMTILQFLQSYNTYTAQTGAALTLRAVRGLDTAGTGGTGRMVVYRNDPQVLKQRIPMPHRFLPAWQRSPLRFDVPGIFRLAPLEIRRPKAIRYIDGIFEAPYH